MLLTVPQSNTTVPTDFLHCLASRKQVFPTDCIACKKIYQFLKLNCHVLFKTICDRKKLLLNLKSVQKYTLENLNIYGNQNSCFIALLVAYGNIKQFFTGCRWIHIESHQQV